MSLKRQPALKLENEILLISTSSINKQTHNANGLENLNKNKKSNIKHLWSQVIVVSVGNWCFQIAILSEDQVDVLRPRKFSCFSFIIKLNN